MAGVRVPTNSLRLMSWNFSTVHKHVRENWLVWIHLLGGRQVPTKLYPQVLHPQSSEPFQGWGFQHFPGQLQSIAGSRLDTSSGKDVHQKLGQTMRSPKVTYSQPFYHMRSSDT